MPSSSSAPVLPRASRLGRRWQRSIGLVVLTLGAASGLGGCGLGRAPANQPASAPEAEFHAGALGDLSLSPLPRSGLDSGLVDGRGYALYSPYGKAGGSCPAPPKSSWAALVVPSRRDLVAGSGLSPRLLGSRPDGRERLAVYDGHPLYVWRPAKSPGTAAAEGMADGNCRMEVVGASGRPDPRAAG